MGLGIRAYSQLKKADGKEAFDECGELMDDDGWFQVYKNPDFQGRADEIEDSHAYKANDSYGFRAGSYGGYNGWREELAKLAGYPEVEYERHGNKRQSYAAAVWGNPEPGPFMEMINFSDCEGVIGAATSKKLAGDFAKFQERADGHENDRFRELYSEWRKAFEMAADSGCVDFH